MPTYEYICLSCNHEFDAFQSMSAEPLKECPNCNGAVKRKISAGLSPIFKGSGFYQTDYKKESTTSPNKSSVEKPKSVETKPAGSASSESSNTSSSTSNSNS